MTRKLAAVPDPPAPATRRRRSSRAAADVPPADQPAAKPKPARTQLATAVEQTERELLVAMRAKVAADIDAGKVPAHALGGLLKQLREFDKEIRAIDARDNPTPDPAADDDEVEDEEFDAASV